MKKAGMGMGPAHQKHKAVHKAGVEKNVIKKSGPGKVMNGVTKPKINDKAEARQGMKPDASIKSFLGGVPHGKGKKGPGQTGLTSGPMHLEPTMHKSAGKGRTHDFKKDKHGLQGASKPARMAGKNTHGPGILKNKMFMGGKGKGSEK